MSEDKKTQYEIAGLRVAMAVSGRTEQQAAAYAVPAEGEPDIVLIDQAERYLKKYPELRDIETARYMGTGIDFARALLLFDGFQLHASAVVLDGKAYMFSAPCGTGKSTHTEKWVRLFGARYLNDDKPAMRLVNHQWMAYGTPWSGKNDLSSPEGAPVGGVVFLKRGESNEIRAMDPVEAVPFLFSQMARIHPRKHTEQMVALADKFLRAVPVWLLSCRNDDEAAFLSRRTLLGEN